MGFFLWEESAELVKCRRKIPSPEPLRRRAVSRAFCRPVVTAISQPHRLGLDWPISGNLKIRSEKYISKVRRDLLFLMLCFCPLCSQRLLTISLHSRVAFHYFLLYRHTTVSPLNPSCRSHATIPRPSFHSSPPLVKDVISLHKNSLASIPLFPYTEKLIIIPEG